jgi:hypothetical protein
LRFKAISSCPDFGPSSKRGTPLPVTSCDAIPPGGNYASADKMFHRHLLLGSAFLYPKRAFASRRNPCRVRPKPFTRIVAGNVFPSAVQPRHVGAGPHC